MTDLVQQLAEVRAQLEAANIRADNANTANLQLRTQLVDANRARAEAEQALRKHLDTSPIWISLQDYDAMVAERNAALVANERLVGWLTASHPDLSHRKRYDLFHDEKCERYQKGLHFSKPSDCTCGLEEALAAARATGQQPGENR